MIISGIKKYIKSLAVGGGVIDVAKSIFNNSAPKKCSLIYAKDLALDSNKTLELDATIDFNLNMNTSLMDTPAENQVVYTKGAVKQPKTISIKCYIELDKLAQLRDIHKYTIPVWVVYEKPIPSTINQKGYYADSSIYAVQSISVTDEGYHNCVACAFILREMNTFEYRTEYTYDARCNKINKSPTNESQSVSISNRASGDKNPIGLFTGDAVSENLEDLTKK